MNSDSDDENKKPCDYVCYKCKNESSLTISKKEEQIACKTCGYRILYKKRTDRRTEYLCR